MDKLVSQIDIYLKNDLHYEDIVSKVGNLSQGWPKGSLFNSYYTEV